MQHAIQPNPTRPTQLRNATCVYCGTLLKPEGSVPATREHVIGRRFVPKGSLDRDWNLIAAACTSCNNVKSDLEDDISAISMLPAMGHFWPNDDPNFIAEAQRKARSAHSRRSRKAVKDSVETFTIDAPLGIAQFTFTVSSPPQIDVERLMELAKYHISAFFYLTTYEEATTRGKRLPGVFALVSYALRTDWGNRRLQAFTQTTRSWRHRVCANAAKGYFRASIRRKDEECGLWAWALEWNMNLRLAGFFGEESLVESACDTLPFDQTNWIPQGPDKSFAFRTDIPLAENDPDTLFKIDVP